MLPFQAIAPAVATQQGLQQVYMSEYGILYQGDCLKLLSALPDESVDLVFADPPFNLGKEYGEGVSDQMDVDKYLGWSQQWLDESIRVLKPGGGLFVFNLPRWCIEYGAYLPFDIVGINKRVPNELAPIMLERIIAMASNPGQIVVDPFGGAGTTFYAAKKLHRYWIGSEIGDTEPAVERLTNLANGIVEQWESARGNKKLKQRKTTASQLPIPYST